MDCLILVVIVMVLVSIAASGEHETTCFALLSLILIWLLCVLMTMWVGE